MSFKSVIYNMKLHWAEICVEKNDYVGSWDIPCVYGTKRAIMFTRAYYNEKLQAICWKLYCSLIMAESIGEWIFCFLDT
jgi:hypothetical protein